MDSRWLAPRENPALLVAIVRRRARFARLLSEIAGISVEQAYRVFRPLVPEPPRALKPS